MHGKPVQIVCAREDHTFDLNTEALENILLQDNIKEHHVCVVSVAGAFRKGKSFLLDFFLRYLDAQVYLFIDFISKKIHCTGLAV